MSMTILKVQFLSLVDLGGIRIYINGSLHQKPVNLKSRSKKKSLKSKQPLKLPLLLGIPAPMVLR
ncbi:hypothetical protein D6779_07070 [Candidatus Parcubacteria bacterium]|nr:MAG: hypothetical protein D6779_07070 [Candidatus Parcubacteria bacterium]